MNLQDINTQIIFTTVPIWIEKSNGEYSTGTGFFYQKQIDENHSIPFIVTNAHVVKGANKGLISMIKREGEKPNPQEKVNVEFSKADLNRFVDEENDLALIPIGPAMNQMESQGIGIFYRSIDPSILPDEKTIENLSAVEEITFIGYPSGLYDRQNNTPIVRKGITATPIWNDFEGKNRFLIDAGVYPGSSGSPVLILNSGAYTHQGGISLGNRVLFVGIISETLQRKEAETNVYLGLGSVVKGKCLSDFVERVSENI